MPIGYTVSDLHLFSDPSQAHSDQAAIEAAADKADLLVFNGGIFDFQWSRFATETETLAAVVGWIEAPSCRAMDQT